ncbi:MarR family transcriptional regulator [Bradyrhizobium sp. Arg62]|uniref:MarR family winged helix-turn-helix transcriptional regulator n=1 Tax=Bradyrhizobium TaxID=374 RepID=UPI001E599EF8|nr:MULTISPECIES: MarR family transcriptional regulator [Bradyrhizobium]MCC8940257.1 MarR family transcriptional regulator [Bradyrhizobium ivorense]MCC8949964.1 MarR family transcriptional regulator [Bradyrhizobium brasilense]
MPPDLPDPASALGRISTDGQEIVRPFMCEIRSISACLEELARFRANVLGITGPQWMILMAVAYLGKEKGVSVNAVSKLMHVDPSFITTHSKLLEKSGFLRRKSCASDARVVQMWLTAKTRKHFASLAPREAQDELALDEFGVDGSSEFIAKLATLRHRLEKTRSGIQRAKRSIVRNEAR